MNYDHRPVSVEGIKLASRQTGATLRHSRHLIMQEAQIFMDFYSKISSNFFFCAGLGLLLSIIRHIRSISLKAQGVGSICTVFWAAHQQSTPIDVHWGALWRHNGAVKLIVEQWAFSTLRPSTCGLTDVSRLPRLPPPHHHHHQLPTSACTNQISKDTSFSMRDHTGRC